MEAGDAVERLRGDPLAAGQHSILVSLEAFAIAVRANDARRGRKAVAALVLVPNHAAGREALFQFEAGLGLGSVPEQDELLAAVRARDVVEAAVAGHEPIEDLAGAQQRRGGEHADLAVVEVLGALDALGDRRTVLADGVLETVNLVEEGYADRSHG